MNSWKVIWQEDGRKKLKRFKDLEKPTEAVEFGKGLRRRGILDVNVVSARRAYRPPRGSKSPASGWMWCPYCVKYREFEEIAIRLPGEVTLPAEFRCKVCRISIHDYYVRKYNPFLVEKLGYEVAARQRISKPKRTR